MHRLHPRARTQPTRQPEARFRLHPSHQERPIPDYEQREAIAIKGLPLLLPSPAAALERDVAVLLGGRRVRLVLQHIQ